LKNYLDERISIDDSIIEPTVKFVALQPDAYLQEIHNIWGSDLSLLEVGQEYADILEHQDIQNLRGKSLKNLVTIFSLNSHIRNVTVIMARILTAKPHSADVERQISANNRLKTIPRNAMLLKTFIYL